MFSVSIEWSEGASLVNTLADVDRMIRPTSFVVVALLSINEDVPSLLWRQGRCSD